MKISATEFQAYSDQGNSCVSDVYDTFNKVTGEYDVPCIEWEGMYGKHRETYSDQAAVEVALNNHQKDLESWVIRYRMDSEKRVQEARQAKAAQRAEKKRKREINTLGVLFPNLQKLRAEIA